MIYRQKHYEDTLLTFSGKTLSLLIFSFLFITGTFHVHAGGANNNDKDGQEIVFVSGYNVISFHRSELIYKSDEKDDADLIHLIADSYPGLAYPGGIHAFIDQHINYPEEAIAGNTEGVVLVNFIVEKDGTISNAHILRGIGDGCDEEVLRVLDELPEMIPGIIANIPVRIAITLPVRFKLKF